MEHERRTLILIAAVILMLVTAITMVGPLLLDLSRDPRSLGRGDRAEIVIAITEDGLRSNVTRGENHGRVLAHAAVVRHLVSLGEASADRQAPVRAEIPLGADWQRDRLSIVAFVQERRGRAILASAIARATQDRR